MPIKLVKFDKHKHRAILQSILTIHSIQGYCIYQPHMTDPTLPEYDVHKINLKTYINIC